MKEKTREYVIRIAIISILIFLLFFQNTNEQNVDQPTNTSLDIGDMKESFCSRWEEPFESPTYTWENRSGKIVHINCGTTTDLASID